MSVHIVLCVFAIWSISSLLTCLAQDTLNIRLRKHISEDSISGGFRGCSRGQLPPFMMKTRLCAPFSARRAPLILAQMYSFFAFRSECGKHVNQAVIQLKNQTIFPKERPKNFCAPSACLLFTGFLAPTLQIAPPSTSGWIRPWIQSASSS